MAHDPAHTRPAPCHRSHTHTHITAMPHAHSLVCERETHTAFAATLTRCSCDALAPRSGAYVGDLHGASSHPESNPRPPPQLYLKEEPSI